MPPLVSSGEEIRPLLSLPVRMFAVLVVVGIALAAAYSGTAVRPGHLYVLAFLAGIFLRSWLAVAYLPLACLLVLTMGTCAANEVDVYGEAFPPTVRYFLLPFALFGALGVSASRIGEAFWESRS